MTKLKIPIKKLRPYWERVWEEYNDFHIKMGKIEKEMQYEFGNKHIAFFWVDGQLVGIGTPDYSTEMDLVHDTELWKE